MALRGKIELRILIKRSRMQKFLPSDLLQAFFQTQPLKNFQPLPGMPHVRNVKFFAAEILQSGKFRLEKFRDAVRAWAAVFRAEVKIPLVPFGEDFAHVIPTGVFWRRQDESWFQIGLGELIGFPLHFTLQIVRYFRSCRFRWNWHPSPVILT